MDEAAADTLAAVAPEAEAAVCTAAWTIAVVWDGALAAAVWTTAEVALGTEATVVCTTAANSELAVPASTLKAPGLLATTATAAVAMVTACSTTACWAGVRAETDCAPPPLAESET